MQQQIWDLGDLYQGLDDLCLDADRQRLEKAVAQFEQHTSSRLEQVIQEPELMAAALGDYAKIQALLHNLMVYAVLEWNVATQDLAVCSFRDQLNRQVSEWSNRLEFFRQALSHLSASQVEFLLAHDEVANYGAFLQRVRRFQPYLLSEAEERLMQLMRTYSRQRWLDFYTQTTSTWIYQVQDQELTEDQAMDCLRKTDPQLRLAGYESVYGTYHDQRDFISYIYNSMIQEHAQEAGLRGFDSTLAQQAFEQELRAEQVLTLLSEVKMRLPLFQRYYRLLARNLGVERLRSCDLSAPLRAEDWRVSWEMGQQILLEALEPLGAEPCGKVAEFFSQRWIHAQPLKGKSSGAFCAPAAQQHPYVLMNWNDNLYSLTALAHELGHGLHFYETIEQQH
ncbi:MAG: hypothetical protein CVV27_06665, partial [Candidatus Melainabacteria bacterium HGW-Melainabacteria-1]